MLGQVQIKPIKQKLKNNAVNVKLSNVHSKNKIIIDLNIRALLNELSNYGKTDEKNYNQVSLFGWGASCF